MGARALDKDEKSVIMSSFLTLSYGCVKGYDKAIFERKLCFRPICRILASVRGSNFIFPLHRYCINVCIETSCFCNKNVLDKISDYIDFFLCDLKAYDENVHKCLTGVSNKIILENLRHLDATRKNIEVRIPYIPGFNDSEMEKIANFIKDMKSIRSVRIMPFHKYAASKYKALGIKNTMPDNTPTDEDIHRMQELIKSITGFAVV